MINFWYREGFIFAITDLFSLGFTSTSVEARCLDTLGSELKWHKNNYHTGYLALTKSVK